MRPLRYSINVTLDGCCDHRAIPADEDLHRHAAESIAQADALLFGRCTGYADESEAVVFERYRAADTDIEHFSNISHLMEPLPYTQTAFTPPTPQSDAWRRDRARIAS